MCTEILHLGYNPKFELLSTQLQSRSTFLGYCFSASLPPMLAAGSLKALSLMDENPAMFEDLHEKCQVMQESFDSCQGLELSGDVLSPVKHLHLAESRRRSRDEDKRLLRRIVAEVNYLPIDS